MSLTERGSRKLAPRLDDRRRPEIQAVGTTSDNDREDREAWQDREAGEARDRDAGVILHETLFGPRPIGWTLFGPLAIVAVAIGGVIAAGFVKTDGGAVAVALSAPVAFLALVPAPALQLALVLRRRRAWSAQEAYLWLSIITADRLRVEEGERSFSIRPHSEAPLVAAADEAARAETTRSSTEQELLRGLRAALLAAYRGGDCLAPLATAREIVGRPSAAYSRRIVATRYRGVIAAALGGLWILVAIVVGMAAAGGVVWL